MAKLIFLFLIFSLPLMAQNQHLLPDYVRNRAFSLRQQLTGQKVLLTALKERSVSLDDVKNVYENCSVIEMNAFALSIELSPYENRSPLVKQCRADLNVSIAKIADVKIKAARGIKYFSGFGGGVLLFGANQMVAKKRRALDKGIQELDRGITLMETLNE
ncbi:MAG: hypothetical protein LLG04_01100 [Parachlamydia sp.]|nr:hypothetical protein [Parachlamydia sp.]